MECCNCIYYDKCRELPVTEDGCADYKDKILYIGFPCKIGTTVYLPTHVGGRISGNIAEPKVTAYSVGIGGVKMELKMGYGFREVPVSKIGKYIFLTKAEAQNYIAKQKGRNTKDE